MRSASASLIATAFLFAVGCEDPRAAPVPTNGDDSVGPVGGGRTDGGTIRPTPTATSKPADAAAPPDPSELDAGAPPNSGLPQKPGAIPGGGNPPRAPAVCSRETSGLGLARFSPLATVPPAFAAAWRQELQASVAPPLVLGLRNLTRGPVAASLGPVHSVSPSTWKFEAPPLTVRTVFVQVDPLNSLHITVPPLSTTAVVSFGDSVGRRGFTIIKFSMDGILAGQCESIAGSMRFLIPVANAPQPFGGSTVGNLLGPMTADANADGISDSWLVELAGTATFVNVEGAP